MLLMRTYFDTLEEKTKRAGMQCRIFSTKSNGGVMSVEAAGDRLKTAGDILEFDEFFVADEALCFDDKAFDKRVRAAGAAELLQSFRDVLADTEPFDHATCEAALRSFIELKDIKIGDIIHALRVAITGKGVGLGMFEALEILGKDRCLARIGRCLDKVEAADK